MYTPTKISAALALALLSAQVQAVEFSFLSGAVTPEAYGNSYSTTVDGLTLTATAWATTGVFGRFQTAELEAYAGFGLGVCNRSEGLNCPSKNNAPALDNRGADDLILFTFSQSVNLETVKFFQLAGDSDLNLWAGSGPINLNGIRSRDLGRAIFVNNTDSSNTLRTIGLGGGFSGTYDWLAVGPRVNQNNDFINLSSLNVTPVPEPQTWTMILAALGLIGFAVRRRT